MWLEAPSLALLLMWSCSRFAVADALHRSSFIFRERFNLSGQLRDLLEDGAPDAPVAPAGHGGPFAVAWRNYMKSVFTKGFMYRLSCKPSVILYIAENKTLAGKEDRSYEGEALGRKMAVVFFEDMRGGLIRRVRRETLGMNQVLLSIAEVLQTLGGIAVPADPERTAAQTELLLESQYEHLEVLRFNCSVEPAAPEAHVFHLGDEMQAETALALEVPAEHRTKMMLARCLQRHDEFLDEETLQGAWNSTLAALSSSSTSPPSTSSTSSTCSRCSTRTRARPRSCSPCTPSTCRTSSRTRSRPRWSPSRTSCTCSWTRSRPRWSPSRTCCTGSRARTRQRTRQSLREPVQSSLHRAVPVSAVPEK